MSREILINILTGSEQPMTAAQIFDTGRFEHRVTVGSCLAAASKNGDIHRVKRLNDDGKEVFFYSLSPIADEFGTKAEPTEKVAAPIIVAKPAPVKQKAVKLQTEAAEIIEKAEALIKETVATSEQVGGKHYMGMAIQPFEYIHANNIPFAEGNVIKYVSRWREKGGIEDLLKAKHFIDLIIAAEAQNKYF